MKFFISIDLEGCAGVVGMMNGTLDDHEKNYKLACEQAVLEANAVAAALFDNGADEVVICDGHGDGTNLEYRNLDERCKILLGTPMRKRFEIMQNDFDGMFMVGYHVMEGNVGTIAHTFNSRKYQYIKVNGKQVGEIEIDSIVAGRRGVPVLFISADNNAVKEARDIIPDIKYVETKECLGRNYILTKHPNAVLKEMYEEAGKAVRDMKNIKPYAPKGPYELEISFTRTEDTEYAVKFLGFKSINAHTVVTTMEELDEFF